MNFTNDWRDSTQSVKDKLRYTLTNENTQQDVVIIAGCGSTETKIKAHSFMLFIGSQVFERMLEQAKVNNDGIKEIKIPDVRPEEMRFILNYIYTDNFDMQNENTLDILYACIKLNLRHLASLCVSKLEVEISAKNVLRVFEEAQKMEVQQLVQISQDFISKNACDVFQSEQFLNISNESLCKLLVFDELEINEVSLFKSVLSWGKAECERSELEENSENLRYVLKKVVPLIRFTLMTIDQFATVVVPTNILDDKEIIGLYNYLSVKNLDASKRTEPPQWIFSSSARGKTVMLNHNSKSLVKERLLEYLKQKSQTNTISGLSFSHNADTKQGIQTIQNITGVQPGILNLRMPSYTDGAFKWESFTEEIISLWKNGYLIHLIWYDTQHPLVNLKDFQTTDPTKWQDVIEDNGQLNKMWKNQIDVIVPYFIQLQNAGVAVICDLLPYINYKSNSWNGRPGKDGSMKLYQITHDYLTKHHGLHSVLWAWSLYKPSDMTKFEEYWPGENYVDIASMHMWGNHSLDINLYHKLLKVVGNTPISMEHIYTVPTTELLAVQSAWTCFTVDCRTLQNASCNNNEKVKTTFTSMAVINKENNDFFITSVSTKKD